MIPGTTLAPAAFAAALAGTLSSACAPECTHLRDCAGNQDCNVDGSCELVDELPSVTSPDVPAGHSRPPDARSWLSGDVGPVTGVDGSAETYLDPGWGSAMI